jgi:hypothetical protein
MDMVVGITTTKYSAVLRRILIEYTEGAQVVIDKRLYREEQIKELLTSWCTNRKIENTRDFQLIRDGQVLFGFHDHPSELWAAVSELPFVERLRDEHILRFELLSVR